MTHTCERCGKAFETKPSDLGRFCSRACHYASRGPDVRPRKARCDRGEKSAGWKGGRSVSHGYVIIGDGRKREHVAIAERALGHALPPQAVVHHVNRVRSDNRNSNLVVLENSAEHNALHRRLRVRDAGGNPWTDYFCNLCGRARHRKCFYLEKPNGRCIDCTRIESRERMRGKYVKKATA